MAEDRKHEQLLPPFYPRFPTRRQASLEPVRVGARSSALRGMVGVRRGGEAEGAPDPTSCDRPYLASPLTRRTNKKGAPPFDSFRVLLIIGFYATGSPSFPIKVLISAGCVPQNRKEMTYA